MIWEQKVATVVMLTNLKERKEVSEFQPYFLNYALLLGLPLQPSLCTEGLYGASQKDLRRNVLQIDFTGCGQRCNDAI